MNRADQRSSAADGLCGLKRDPDELLVVHPQITQITQNHLTTYRWRFSARAVAEPPRPKSLGESHQDKLIHSMFFLRHILALSASVH